MISIYPSQVQNIILLKTFKSYVPKKLNNKEHLKLFHKYFSLEEKSPFKVEKVYEINGIEYYSIKYILNHQYALISYPVDVNSYYELILDRNKLNEIDIINDSSLFLYGSEIKYWFFINNIDLDNKKYIGFRTFILYNHNNTISDSKQYTIKADVDKKGCYCNIRFMGAK